MEISEALEIVVGRTGHERYRELCDPSSPTYDPRYVPIVIEMAGGEPAPPAPPVRLAPPIPLAGDVVEAIAKRLGADRLAKWWERQTGLDCGCDERRRRLNRATKRLLKWAGIGDRD